VTDHELGHVASLPDAYDYAETMNGQSIPDAIMVHADSIKNFDILMLRKVWEWAWNTTYAP
jgi:hypothetical protein